MSNEDNPLQEPTPVAPMVETHTGMQELTVEAEKELIESNKMPVEMDVEAKPINQNFLDEYLTVEEKLEKFQVKKNNLTMRLLKYTEDAILLEAAKIDVTSWGPGFNVSKEEFKSRAINGFVIGAFSPDGLEGTISILQADEKELNKIGSKPTSTNTWDGLTGNGSFTTSDQEGNVLACVAVTSKASPYRPLDLENSTDWKKELLNLENKISLDYLKAALIQGNWSKNIRMDKFISKITSELIQIYLDNDLDFVLKFHSQPKAGLKEGAKIWRIVPKGREEDLDSMGYNVVMMYPKITEALREKFLKLIQNPLESEDKSVGSALVEAAYALGCMLDVIEIVAPYSRPGAFRKYLLKTIDFIQGNLPVLSLKDDERNFFEKARPIIENAINGQEVKS